MRTNILLTIALGAAIGLGALTGCEKNNGPATGEGGASGPDKATRKYITLTAAIPDAEGTAGNGGTMAYSITPEQAAESNYVVNVIKDGYALRSQRTARVQGSINGNFLYNIQYTGNDGGIFNKYRVEGAEKFKDTYEEVDTEPILGAAPRWVVAAEGLGVGVYASAKILGSKEGAGADFVNVVSTAKIALLDLNDPHIARQTEFTIPLGEDLTKMGYQIGRIDVPVLNAAKNKVLIGCNLTRIDASKQSTVNDDGDQTWKSLANDLGTATLIVDYPSLANPKLIFAKNSKANNHSYRTMTQYVGTDGAVYQATATSGSQILRINANNQYDEGYNFDLKAALSSASDVAIKSWRYIQDGTGIVLYTKADVAGGYLALIDLNKNTAKALATIDETNEGLSGRAKVGSIPAVTGTFSQFQSVAVSGDFVYIPVTPNGQDGSLYVVNWKNGTIVKGASLKNQSGSFYIGAY